MPRRHHCHTPTNEWFLLLDCPFDGNKTDYANNIQLTGSNGNFVLDPVTGTNYCVRFTSDSHRMYLSLSDFAKQDTGRCKIEVDFLCYSHSSPTYPNIIENSKSGNGGLFAQRDSGTWNFGISNRGYNVTQTPSFNTQLLKINPNLITLNRWHHFKIIRIPDLLEIEVTDSYNNQIGYLQNTQVGIFNAALNSHMTQMTIGGSTWGGRYLNGCIKNLKIWLNSNY